MLVPVPRAELGHMVPVIQSTRRADVIEQCFMEGTLSQIAKCPQVGREQQWQEMVGSSLSSIFANCTVRRHLAALNRHETSGTIFFRRAQALCFLPREGMRGFLRTIDTQATLPQTISLPATGLASVRIVELANGIAEGAAALVAVLSNAHPTLRQAQMLRRVAATAGGGQS